jgi:hypothetical protein
LHLLDGGSVNLRLRFGDSAEDRRRMLFDKIGELTSLDQRANLRKTSGRMRVAPKLSLMVMGMVMMLMMVVRMVVALVIVMLLVVIPMFVMFVVMMPWMRGFGVGLVGWRGSARCALLLRRVSSVLGGVVRCSGVNVEFYAGDSCARLPLEMEVAIPQIQFRELPFEGGGGNSQIGQSADGHVAADPRKTVQVEDTHLDLPTLKTSRWTRAVLRACAAFWTIGACGVWP